MNWYDEIIEKVTLMADKPILVIDPQEYLAFDQIQETIKNKGYALECIKPSNSLDVRMAFELKARGKTNFILDVLGEYEPLDDIKADSCIVRLNSKEIFRNLDEKALKGLCFEILTEVSKLNVYKPLGYKETIDFIAKNVNIKQLNAERLLTIIKRQTKIIDNQFNHWFDLVPKLGELGNLVYELQNEELENKYNITVESLNERFQDFINKSYESLFSLSGLKQPATIDKIQDYISYNSKNRRIALIVIDGMNFWQWTMLKQSLVKTGLQVEGKASLTWLPSITAWARQSIFKGKKPDISTDNKKEDELFFNYWINKQIQPFQISYNKVEVNQKLKIPNSNIKVAGFVYNALDEMMHGSVLGNRQLYNSTALWIKESGICETIKDLKNNDFDIYISTDHGNIDANLNCKVSAVEKTLSWSRSKRFIKFDTEQQAEDFINKNFEFKLGRRGNSVYCRDNNGFGTSGQREITHGGSHILEMIIPLGIIK